MFDRCQSLIDMDAAHFYVATNAKWAVFIWCFSSPADNLKLFFTCSYSFSSSTKYFLSITGIHTPMDGSEVTRGSVSSTKRCGLRKPEIQPLIFLLSNIRHLNPYQIDVDAVLKFSSLKYDEEDPGMSSS